MWRLRLTQHAKGLPPAATVYGRLLRFRRGPLSILNYRLLMRVGNG